MKRTPYFVRSGLSGALLLVAAAACGSDEVPAAAPASASSTSSVAPSPAGTPTPTLTPAAQAFVTGFRAAVASGDYEPTKGTSTEARNGAEAYVADLSDDRLVAAGQFACQARTDGLDEAGFVLLLLKNPQTEEGIKPLLNLLWDEATTTLCPK